MAHSQTATQIKKSLYLFSTVNEAKQFFADLADNHYVIRSPVVYCTGNDTVYYDFPDHSSEYTGRISALEPEPI
jgi:hypothetical protein